jgi:uncharacterized protein YjbI with pentapeptide repeats
MISLRGRVLGIVATAAVTAGTVVLWSGAASAVTCPSVARGTGMVTPAPTPGVDWSGCHLAGANLSGADLSGADLSGANLERANLTGSNLSGANLADSFIDNAELPHADLNGTILAGIYTVVGVTSGGITGTPASLPDTQLGPTHLIDGYLAGPDVNLDGADLASANLAGIRFEAATFVGADLASANLTGASVDGDLASANLSGTDLAGAYLAGVSSGAITGTPSALPANWRLVDGYLIGPDAQVTQANLTGANLSGADMQMINLTGTNLTDADMAGADLADAGLGLTTLTGANLIGADLAKLASWSITGTPTALPQHWTLRSGFLFGPQAWFYGVDLSGQNLSGLDLAGAFLENSNLTRANLSGTNLAGANLAAATIAKADLARTVLAGASLYVIRSGGGITGSPASIPAGWVLRSGWLIGPSVFLDYGNLNGLNLSGTDMAGAETNWTTFTGANLSGTDLAGSFLTASDFTKADLRGADLFGADLNTDTWTGATCPDGTSASSHGGSCAGAIAFRFAGFITPKPGSTIAVSARHVSVHFKLATASGATIPASVAAAIATAKQVRITLAGPGIKPTTAYCSWDSSRGEFACTIADPRGIKKGTSHSYTITAAEKPGTSFQSAPRLSTAANPETIHFR